MGKNTTMNMSQQSQRFISNEKDWDKWTEKDKEKYFNACAKMLHNSLVKFQNNIGYNNGLIENMVEFMQDEPMIFGFSQTPENRNFLKWAIDENIKYNKLLLKHIAKIEKDLDLPTENPETPSDFAEFIKKTK